jgi:hypothetical protein
VYSAGIIYVTCGDGLHALALNAAAPSFAPVAGWQVPSAVVGPPIVAGGLVWATAWDHAALYGLNPSSGQIVVKQSTPAMEHFTTPSASDGKLFLATGQTVEAYTIANPLPPPAAVPPPPPSPATCVLRLRSHRIKVHVPRRRRHHRRAMPFATVRLVARCDQTVQVRLTGTVTERLPGRTRHGKARTRTFRLASGRTTLAGGVARTLQIRLTPFLWHALERRIRETGTFTLTAVSGGGTTRTRARGRLRL